MNKKDKVISFVKTHKTNILILCGTVLGAGALFVGVRLHPNKNVLYEDKFVVPVRWKKGTLFQKSWLSDPARSPFDSIKYKFNDGNVVTIYAANHAKPDDITTLVESVKDAIDKAGECRVLIGFEDK